MAEARRFTCQGCDREIIAWSDGNPYVIEATGKKRHVYHPDPDLKLSVGNDVPHLCLDCGKEFTIDSRAPIDACPRCSSKQIERTWSLDGCRCPYCATGRFVRDPDWYAIS